MSARETIPELLLAAADRDPEGTWLRVDEGTLTFAAAVGQVAELAARLGQEGIGTGDLVVLPARTKPPFLLCWLALASLGAITVPTDPDATPTEQEGLIGQVQPKTVIGDVATATLQIGPLVGDWTAPVSHGAVLPMNVAPDDLAVLIPTSGTTGRSKLVMQTHRAYAWAGEGFPAWVGLDRRRPAHDVAPALPHQCPRLLGSRIARLRRRSRPAAPLLGQRVPGRRAQTRRDGVQRDRRHARDLDAPARSTRRCRHRPAALLHRPLSHQGVAGGV